MRTLPLAAGVAAGLVALVVAVALREAGSAADRTPGGRVAGAGPSSAISYTPVPAASLPSGLPSDSGAGDPVSTIGAGDPTASSAPTTEATEGPLDAVVLAAGVLQYLHCSGSSQTSGVTVVVVPGLSVTHDAWSAQTDALEQVTRTCVYDRPGIGQSPPRSSPLQVVDAGVEARELATLLAAAGQKSPYVLVGQGYGTLVARAFSRLYAGQVRALVLGGHAPAAGGSQLFWTEAGHRIDISASDRAAGAAPVASSTLQVATVTTDDPAQIVAALATVGVR